MNGLFFLKIYFFFPPETHAKYFLDPARAISRNNSYDFMQVITNNWPRSSLRFSG